LGFFEKPTFAVLVFYFIFYLHEHEELNEVVVVCTQTVFTSCDKLKVEGVF